MKYWCAILSGLSFVFLFFFQEETNFHRKALVGRGTENNASGGSESHESNERDGAVNEQKMDATTITDEKGGSENVPRRRPYYHRLKVFDKQRLHHPNGLRDMVLRPLIFLSFPVISYCGFSYGCYLVWYNVLNGTTSLILSGNSYEFSSSDVGLAYLSPLIGTTLG